ncbi:ATP-binding cassette domain-containing protein [Macrococcus animalis]|uniref:ATP-binding cassette domain-containing protein n=1 Tax=Macrococcus animalis TaxID=3395467 RepID=UPI0039BEB8DF
MFLAWKEVVHNKLKYSLIIGVLILISYLLFLISGLSYGLMDINRESLDKWNPDAIVVTKESNQNIAQSIMAEDALDNKFDKIAKLKSVAVTILKVKDQFKLLDKVKHEHLSQDELKSEVDKLGLQDVMNQFPSELSGGQRQRVAILKAIYTNPSLILADEHTASLDSEKAFEVMKLIKNEVKSRNKAAIIVTHDNRLLDYFDKVYMMSDGVLKLKH